MTRKKKNFYIRKLLSLLLCMTVCLVLGTASLTKTNKAQAASVTITQMHTLSGFEINETAAVRRINPVGLRFTTEVSADTQARLKALLDPDDSGDEIVYGTLFLPADLLADEELTHDTPLVTYRDVAANEWKNATTYAVVLGGEEGDDLDESYYSRPILARSYALNKDTGVVYYTENTALRSIGYVAYKAVNDPDPTRRDTHENVKAIANHSETKKELVFNESISVHNSASSGTGVIVNGVNSQSASLFAVKIGGIIDMETEISYTTDNESVIAIENGVPTAKSEGKANVTATAIVNGERITQTQTVSTTSYAPSSLYRILIPASAGEYETQAAKKLQSVLQEATGIRLAIVTESGQEKTSDRYLSIGETKLAKNSCLVDDLEKETASRVKTVDNTVFIRGKVERATLYGVQQLLDDTVGYEYFMEDSYLLNKKSEFIVTDKDYVPDIEHEVMQKMWDGEISSEHASPSYTEGIVPVGADDYSGVAHNSILVIKGVDQAGVEDTSRFYSSSSLKYKDWYATSTVWGIHIFHQDGSQHKLELCYTAHGNISAENGRPALVETVASAMFSQMQKEAFKSYNRVGFSLSDANYWCECTTCNAEGNPSDNLLHFLLDVAASLKSKLTAAGDARADTFKICSLFYNSTNLAPKNMTEYQSAVDNYMRHMEIWFAETGIDFVTPLTDTTRPWNKGALEQFNAWANIANTYGSDMLWWGYYASVKSGFIPFDSIDALRGNYALAMDSGVDYMFNQAIGYRINWTRLKQYLMSELRWNAKPTDDEWNGWIADYMQGTFGQGAAAMTEYFNLWNEWTDANASKFTNSLTSYLTSGDTASAKSNYGQKRSAMTTAIGYDPRTSSLMPLETLTAWLNACNKAIAALDVNDTNYQTYYDNIILERLTPLYLIMYVHGGFNGSSFSNLENVIPYAQDFLDGIEAWEVTYDGEGIGGNNQLPQLKTAMESALSNVTEREVTERQNVLVGASITVNNANIASGETYTAALVNGTEVLMATGVTVNAGSATLTFAAEPTAGECVITLRSSTKIITFTNVFLADGFIKTYAQFKAFSSGTKSGYYLLAQDIVSDGSAITPANGSNFQGVLDGGGYTVSDLIIGADGVFKTMNGATVKNISFKSCTVDEGAPIFAATANNTVFENVSVEIVGASNRAFVTVETNVTYKSVATVYGADTGKTFFLPIGKSQVVLSDSNLTKGDYTVIVGDEIQKTTVFALGRLTLTVNSLDVGETATVICDNGTNAYVYNVTRVTKLITSFDELTELGIGGDASKTEGNDIDGYYALANDIDGKGALATHDYNWNYSHFKGILDGNGYTVKNFTVGTCGIFGGLKNATIKNINFDEVKLYTKSTAAGWNYSGVLAGNATNVLFENVTLRFKSYQAIATDNPPSIFYKGTFIGEATTNVTYKNVTIDISACESEFTSSVGTIFGTKINGLVCENVTVLVSNTSLTQRTDFFGYTEGKTVTIACPDGVTVTKA